MLPTTSGLPTMRLLEREVAIEDAGLLAAALEPGEDRLALLRRERAARAFELDRRARNACAMSGTMVGSVLQPARRTNGQAHEPRRPVIESRHGAFFRIFVDERGYAQPRRESVRGRTVEDRVAYV